MNGNGKREIVIEVCHNCRVHDWCTHHDEKKYESNFESVKAAIISTVPNCQVFKNQDLNPRIVLAGCSDVKSCKLLFSKMKSGLWPSAVAVAQRIKSYFDDLEEGKNVEQYGAGTEKAVVAPKKKPSPYRTTLGSFNSAGGSPASIPQSSPTKNETNNQKKEEHNVSHKEENNSQKNHKTEEEHEPKHNESPSPKKNTDSKSEHSDKKENHSSDVVSTSESKLENNNESYNPKTEEPAKESHQETRQEVHEEAHQDAKHNTHQESYDSATDKKSDNETHKEVEKAEEHKEVHVEANKEVSVEQPAHNKNDHEEPSKISTHQQEEEEESPSKLYPESPAYTKGLDAQSNPSDTITAAQGIDKEPKSEVSSPTKQRDVKEEEEYDEDFVSP